jgi:nucleotide-binding universal stress UspA family protein
MKILFSNALTENAPGARVAQLLAERVGGTMGRLQLSGERTSRMFSDGNGSRGEETPSGVRELGSGKPELRATAEKNSGALSKDLPAEASTASPQLIVALPSSRGTSEDTHVTERLALSTRVPTLVVHEPARILAWLRGKRALRVLCAHDLTAVADEALRFVRQLSKAGRCEITLAHVHRSVEQLSHPGCAGLGSMRKHDLEMRSLLEGKLRERARILLGDESVGTRVSPAPFRRDDFILDVIRDTDADLVVAPLHPYAGTGASLCTATSRTLLCFADANLILVPPTLVSTAMPKHVVRRVLVVTDLTPSDARVIAQARALLGPGGTLRVLHVLHPHAVPDTEYDRSLSFRQQVAAHLRLVESSSKRLRALAQDEARVSGSAVESELVEHRDRAVAIASAAERFDADIVCLALAERPTLLTRLFGSQIRRILKEAKRSLLIVQPATA